MRGGGERTLYLTFCQTHESNYKNPRYFYESLDCFALATQGLAMTIRHTQRRHCKNCKAIRGNPFGRLKIKGDSAQIHTIYLLWIASAFATPRNDGVGRYSIAKIAAIRGNPLYTPLLKESKCKLKS